MLSLFEEIADKIVGLNELIDLAGDLEQEKTLRLLESLISTNNQFLIKETALALGEQLVEGVALPEISNAKRACVYRYLVVPILYKIGRSSDAALLNQKTFEYLFPAYHQMVLEQLDCLFGVSWEIACDAVFQQFSPPNVSWQYAYRIKSTHSIWKKVPSLNRLKKMNIDDFSNTVCDMLAMRWFIEPVNNENRYDAILNGVRAANKTGLLSFRNQQLKQGSGFSEEPVIKLLYSVDRFPIELQILGGKLDYYLSAKGYAVYKAGLPFYPMRADLSDARWYARLGTFIKLQEMGDKLHCRKLLLQELYGDLPEYDERNSYCPESRPNLSINLEYQFDCVQNALPVYQLKRFEFS